MQEFSSISVSSYEAGILADRLTEQSSEGWHVVAIVPTGSTVTAYLSRPAGVGVATDAAVADADQPHVDADAEADQHAEVEVEPEVEPEVEHAPADTAGPDDDHAEPDQHADADHAELDAEVEAEAGAETLIEEVGSDASATDDDGWAALASEVAATDEEIVPTLADTTTEPEATFGETEIGSVAAAADSGGVAEVAPEPAAEPAAEPEVAAVAAAGGAAPAGWYADPSSRFELRYWDGAQWTEHVSRGGQQYTDPPVA